MIEEFEELKKVFKEINKELLDAIKTLVPPTNVTSDLMSYKVNGNNFYSIYENTDGTSSLEIKQISIIPTGVTDPVSTFNTAIVLNPFESTIFNNTSIFDWSSQPLPNVGFYTCNQFILKPRAKIGVTLTNTGTSVPTGLGFTGVISYVRHSGS